MAGSVDLKARQLDHTGLFCDDDEDRMILLLPDDVRFS